jgi:hypothetical protein
VKELHRRLCLACAARFDEAWTVRLLYRMDYPRKEKCEECRKRLAEGLYSIGAKQTISH